MSIKVHEPDKKSGRGGTDILSALLKSGVELKGHKSNAETKDAGRVGQKRDRVTAGDKKEEERMQQKTDMDALKKQSEALDSEAAKKPEADGKKEEGAAKPKKKNIIQVFRPQNSKTGMVKPGSRPRPQGQGRPQRSPGQSGARPAGRPQGQAGNARTPEQAASAKAGAMRTPEQAASAKAGAMRTPEQAVAAKTGTVRTPEQTAAVKQGAARTAEPQGSVKPEEGKAVQAAGRTETVKAAVQAENNGPSAAKTENVQASETAAEKNTAQTSSGKPEAVRAEKPVQPEIKVTAAKAAAQTESIKTGKAVQTAEKMGVQVQTAKAEPVQGEMKMQENKQPEAKAAAPAAEKTQSSVKNQGQQNTARVQGSRGQNGGRVQDGRTQNSGARSQNNRGQDSRSQSGRNQDGNQGGRRYQDGGQNRGQGNRYQDGGQNRSQGGRSQDGGQGRNQGGRYQDGGQNRGQGNRYQDGGQNRGQGNRYQDGGQNRNQGGRYQDGGQNRSQGNRYQDGGQNRGTGRSQDNGQNRGQGGRMQNGRSMGIPKPPVESKPLEKESRKRTERGDRNRDSKGEKLDRLEQSGRPGKKGGQQRPAKVAKPVPKPVEKQEEVIKNITIPEKLTIKELGEAMKVQPSAIVKKLFLQGVMVTVNEEIEFEKAEEIALEFNCICEKEEKVNVLEELLKEEEEDESALIPRSPVVCVMGHVDHGKTSLLDAIRNTHVIDREAGGITQHIGAYVVSIDGQKITFLDTPGHEAFTAMRMRGANATDIAILVVAADDGVMPQTIEAINHAKAAGIEIIVAINKIDKPSANVERVKQELSEYELIPEDWGGSTVFVPVSAHTHEGIDTLLEMILLTAEVSELRANPNRKARGLVIEAQLDKGKGPVATVLVQKGTLHVGDPVAAGSCYGKVRAMMDDKGRRVKEAGPSTPVEILGFSDVPNAGEIFMAMDNEKEARSFAETFISEGRERLLEETKARMSLDDLFSQIQAGNLKELNIIVKADVQGSVEAVKQSLLKLSNEEVIIKIIHGGVGAINESDVILASASNAIIIGFNVRPDAMAKTTAEREGVDVRLYRVIYDAIADVEAAMKGMLDPIYEEKVIGHAEVRQTFRASGVGTIAGGYVTDGIFQRNCKIRITRDGEQIYEGSLASLKRFKDDVKEVKAGYECGLVFEKFNDVREEDKVEAYIMVEVPR